MTAQETIGPWSVQAAPASATSVLKPVAGDWLNVVNVAIDVNEAFTGFSILDDGWANIQLGDTVDVTFMPPIPNIDGPDFVLLEGHYDEGSYVVSCDYDGYSATIAVVPGIDSGEDRSYYYAGAVSGPFDADIFGVEIDLTALGVPPGNTVSGVRFEATNSQCDPIGIGALADPVPVELMSLTVE